MRGVPLLMTVLLPMAVGAAQVDSPNGSLMAEVQAQQEVAVLGKFAPEQRAQLELIVSDMRRKNLPTTPLIDRLGDEKRKGTPDAEVVVIAQEVAGRLESSARSLARGGRTQPDPREVALGAAILERGCSPVQLHSVIKTATPNRSLVVPFEVMLKLADRGMGIDAAAAQVSGKLVAKASDGDITMLLQTLSKA